jgi:hypothetical protein
MSAKPANISNPCVCCGDRPHDSYPDRELNGYVCKECAPFLAVATAALRVSGFCSILRSLIDPETRPLIP